MVTHLKFDNFVVREMAGSASSLPAILAKIAQLLSWAKSSNFFYKNKQICLHNHKRNLYFIKILEIQFYLTFISWGKNSEGSIMVRFFFL